MKWKPVTMPHSSTLAQTLSVNIAKSESCSIGNKKINFVDETKKKAVWAFPWSCCANSSNEENMSLSSKTDTGDVHKYGKSCQRSRGKHVKSGLGWINPLKQRIVPLEMWNRRLVIGLRCVVSMCRVTEKGCRTKKSTSEKAYGKLDLIPQKWLW